MKLTRNLAYWLLALSSTLWTASVLLAPWSRSQGWGLASWAYGFFAPVCHQLPERSFAAFGHPLAVCHRCSGLYAGFTAGLLLLPYLGWLRRRLLASPRAVLLFFVPMVVDVFLVDNTPLSRFLTGWVAAFPVGLFVWAAAEQLSGGMRPVMEENHEPG